MPARRSLSKAALPAISEKAFQAQIVELARLRGWLCYHTHNSRRSASGFPDLCLVRLEKAGQWARLVFAEVKTDTGPLTREQREWLLYLTLVPGAEVRVWRPDDWQAIEELLR